MDIIHDAVVVGGGPCGIAAAIQLKRSGFEPLLFERSVPGGLLHNADRVENYPGFPEGISGPGLCRLIERHLRSAGVTPVIESVHHVERTGRGAYRLETVSGRRFVSRVLILATGTRPVTGLFAEPEPLVGRLIFYDVASLPDAGPGALALIIGGGDAAHDYALNLARRGIEVTLIRRGTAKCLPLLRSRVRSNTSISERPGRVVTEIVELGDGVAVTVTAGDGGAATRKGRSGEKGGPEIVVGDFVLIACGRKPEDELLNSLVPSGILTGRLPPGLFIGGDLVRGRLRQTGIAVGDGLKTAMDAVEYLNRSGT